jgi:transcriptional regulator with XRE-family HTH domain
MPAATISPTVPAAPAEWEWGPDQMIGTSTPSATAGKSRFRTARERRELTQQQVADRCELSLKTIKRYDGGGRPRNVEIAQRLAEVLDQPLEWLWPPEANLNVRVARANYPVAPPADPPTIPDPHAVLATLHRTRPRLRRPGRWLVAVIALATVAVAATAVVLATTGHKHPAAASTSAKPPVGIAPTLTAAPPPLLAASARDTKNDRPASKRQHNPRAHASKRHHRSTPSQKRTTRRSSGSSPAASTRVAQPVSTTQQAVASTATASAATPASSAPVKHQPGNTAGSGGGEFLP